MAPGPFPMLGPGVWSMGASYVRAVSATMTSATRSLCNRAQRARGLLSDEAAQRVDIENLYLAPARLDPTELSQQMQ